MATDAITPAAPSAAPQAEPEIDLSTLSEAEHHAWRMTGELPKRDTSTQADSSTAKKENSEVEKTESASASEAGKEQKPKRDNAETRIKELLAKTKQLESELEEARKPRTAETKTESAPVKQAEQPKEVQPPKKPNLEEYIKAGKKIEEYDADTEKFHEDNTKYLIQKALAEHQQKQQLEAAQRKAREEFAAAEKRYPDLKDVIFPFSQELGKANPLVQAALNRSDVLHDLLYVIASKPEDRAAFLEEAANDPVAAIERIAITSRLVKAELAKGKSDSKETPTRGEDGKFKASETKVTKAPPPAPEVNSNNSAPGDDSEEALKSDDVRKYMEAENARALRMKRRY